MRCRIRAIAAPALVLACLSAACSSTQTSINAPTADKCQVSASSSPSAFAAGGGQGSLAITTARECTWSITTDASWVSIAGERGGQGEASIPYAVAPNPVPAPRSAVVVVGSQSVALTQAAAPCTYALSRSGDVIGYGGGRLAVDVATLNGCGWTAVSDAAWISVASGPNGNGSAAVGLAVAANAGAARVGRVNVAGQIYTVSQDGAPPAPSPSPTPSPVPPPSPTPQPTPSPAPPPAPQPTPSPQPPPQPVSVDFDGPISGLSGRCPNVTFTIGGATIAVDAATDFNKKSSCTDLRNGRSVSGSGTRQPNGRITATQLQVKK